MKRLLPILTATLVLVACAPGDDPAVSSQAAASQPAGIQAASGAAPEDIRETYLRSCHSCHGPGVTGAPRTGDVAAWKPRAAKGLDVLVTNAMEGYRAMPPRGLCFDCTESEFAGLIRYMAGAALDDTAGAEAGRDTTSAGH
ncbi:MULTISPECIES: cytochrome c5 family protein [Microbulbifer]|uniref:c-type cytochrome n=1 Tax=Microbulbifer TaxID=48073 RepID=UPI001E64C1A5|nr:MULTISPECIES: c-type cytochrome [Microbulbifer]UHQ55189.1 c-type cytochrome [Microbulbifer sp. YPW16]